MCFFCSWSCLHLCLTGALPPVRKAKRIQRMPGLWLWVQKWIASHVHGPLVLL